MSLVAVIAISRKGSVLIGRRKVRMSWALQTNSMSSAFIQQRIVALVEIQLETVPLAKPFQLWKDSEWLHESAYFHRLSSLQKGFL